MSRRHDTPGSTAGWREPWRRLCLLVAFLGFSAAHAALAGDTKVYQWHEDNGVVSFSDTKPPSGSKSVTSREIETRTLSPARKLAIQAQLARLDANEQAASERFRGRVDDADHAIDAALRRLSRAERAMRTGRAPGPGERVGNTNGSSRLRAEYFTRQERLAGAAEQAHRDVDDAYQARQQVSP